MRDDGIALLPASLAIAVFIVWAAMAGGYESLPSLSDAYQPDAWYLGALTLVAVAGVAAMALGRIVLPRPARWALIALAAYVVWSYLSILWAGDRGVATSGSARTLVYGAIFALFVILPWRHRGALWALCGFTAAAAVLVVVTAVALGVRADPSSMYVNGRLASPLGYENASAAFFMIVALLTVALAARRPGPPLALRAAALAVVAVCLQLAVLAQSRGWLGTAPIVVFVVLCVLPQRSRFAAFAILPLAATAAATPALLHVYSAANVRGVLLADPALTTALHHYGQRATVAMLLADAAMVAVFFASAAALRLLGSRSQPLTVPATIRRAIAIALAIAAVGAVLVATHGDPIGRVTSAANTFATGGTQKEGSSHFASSGGHRYDFWRVALDEVAWHPILGLGQDNFAEPYLLHRRSTEEPRWVHSLELRLLSHTGIPGAALFIAFLVAAVVAARRAWAGDPVRREVMAVALIPAVVWVIYGSVDWFWEFPALSGPALAFLGMAASADGAAQRIRRSRGSQLAIGALAVAAIVAVAWPYAGARYVAVALGEWRTNTPAAYRALNRAAELEPWSAEPELVAGAIALANTQPEVARLRFADAHARDSGGWLAPFALGLVATAEHHLAVAGSDFRAALARDPREPLIADALRRLATPSPLQLGGVRRALRNRAAVRFRS